MSAVDISILLGCRVGGNTNSSLITCLNSIVDNATAPARLEILIKFDDDDQGVPQLLGELEALKGRTNIKTIITPRGKGYGDLHKAYNDLLLIADPQSELYWVISDDMEVLTKGWDAKLQQTLGRFEDKIFVAHTLIDFIHPTLIDAIESPDSYPIWSKRWITLTGGFGYTFSTDAWTAMLLQVLQRRYHYNRHVFVPDLVIKRKLAAMDMPGSERWVGIRKDTIELLQTPQVQYLLDESANSIASRIMQSGTVLGRDRSSITPAYVSYSVRKKLLQMQQGPLHYPALLTYRVLKKLKRLLKPSS